jgi:hypothetical protein
MKKFFVILALVFLTVSLEGVEELSDTNFAEKVYSEPKFWLVMFSASWVFINPLSAAIAPISSLKSRS